MNDLNLPPIKTFLAVHLRGKRDRIRHQIGLTRCVTQDQLLIVYRDTRRQKENNAGGHDDQQREQCGEKQQPGGCNLVR